MSEVASQLKTFERRRGQRVAFRIPIQVQGKTPEGKSFEEKTYTLEINRHGARIVLLSKPQPGSKITITNLQTREGRSFQVICRPGKPLEGDKGTEWGVECLDPAHDFWGISFPDREEPAASGEIEVSMECSRCHTVESARVTQVQQQMLAARASLSRRCQECGALTDWALAGASDAESARSSSTRPENPQAQPRPHKERRREKRLAMRLPVRLRLEEIGETETLSPGGLCFRSELSLKVGARVGLTVGYTPGGNNKEITGRVVWRKEIPGATKALYGVQIDREP